jgi:O-antigen/teichoic acid export membrane protein
MLPQDDGEAANLLAGSLAFVLLFSVLIAPVAWVARYPAHAWLVQNGLLSFVWLIPLAVLCTGSQLALTFWETRQRRFGGLSIARIAGAGSGTGTQLAAGAWAHVGAGGLVTSNIVGSGVAAIILGFQAWRQDRRLLQRSVTPSRIRLSLVRHRKFPLYSTWAILLSEAAWQLPTFWLASAFSATIVGFYAVGTRLLRVPMNVIGGAIGQVFFERAAKGKKAGTLPSVVETTFHGLVILGLFPLLMLTVCGEDLAIVMLGDRWSEAGVYVQILAPWMFFWFVSAPLMTLINVLEKQEWGLVFNAALLVSRGAALAVGSAFHSVHLALLLFGVTGVLSYGYLNGRLMAEAGYGWLASSRLIVGKALKFAPAGVVVLAAKYLGVSPLGIAGVATLFGFFYVAYVLRYEPEARKIMRLLRRTPGAQESGG